MRRGGTPRSTQKTIAVDAVETPRFLKIASIEGYEYQQFETGTQPFWTPLRFLGQYADAETGLFENWNRYYDPGAGRYMETEPLLVMAPGVMPAYSYANGNPVNMADPSGLTLYFADSTAKSLASRLSKSAGGAALMNYLEQSPLQFTIYGDVLPPDYFPKNAYGIAGNLKGKETNHVGIRDTGQVCTLPGEDVRLFSTRAILAKLNPVANLGHELIHAALWTIKSTGQTGYPGFLEQWIDDADEDGGLPGEEGDPFSPHALMGETANMAWGNL
nr:MULTISPECIES: RHS repeat-associated core domain-containing protein [Myxococcaceae]